MLIGYVLNLAGTQWRMELRNVGLDGKEVMKHQDETALTRDVATAWNPDHVKI